MFERLQLEVKKDVFPELKLTKGIIQKIIQCTWPVVEMLLFAKDRQTATFAQSALKHLSFLNPDLIFSNLLLTVYPALENLTETHRTNACLASITATCTPLMRNVKNKQHLMLLLNLSLPGLDINVNWKLIRIFRNQLIL